MRTLQKSKDAPADVGVIVGRFQVPELHQGHAEVFNTVMALHDKVVVFVGLSQVRGSTSNPLDFESRKQMILEAYPSVTVLYVKDCKEDAAWSRRLDEMISDQLGPRQTAVLYGSRDSFSAHYTGRFPVEVLVPVTNVSGTEIRRGISRKVMNTREFRAGVIWASFNQYPRCFPTVDVAILDEDCEHVLLGRKPDELQYRFIGGFADPRSASYEADARREVMEEAGIDITDPEFVGSTIVDDWRYRGEAQDRIKTILFVAKRFSGAVRAGDDISEARWFRLKDIKPTDVVDTHAPLLAMLMDYLGRNLARLKPQID